MQTAVLFPPFAAAAPPSAQTAFVTEQEQLTFPLSYEAMSMAHNPSDFSDSICLVSSPGSILYLAPEVFGRPSFSNVAQLIHPQDLDQFFHNVDLIVSSQAGLQLSIRLRTEANKYFLYTGIVRHKRDLSMSLRNQLQLPDSSSNDEPCVLAFTKSQYSQKYQQHQQQQQHSYYTSTFPPTPLPTSASPPPPGQQTQMLSAPANSSATNLWLRRQAARQKNATTIESSINPPPPPPPQQLHQSLHPPTTAASPTASPRNTLHKSYTSPDVSSHSSYLSIIPPINTAESAPANYNLNPNPSPLYDTTVNDSTYSSLQLSSTNSSFASPLDDLYWTGSTLLGPGVSPFSATSSSPRFQYSSNPHSATFLENSHPNQQLHPPIVNTDPAAAAAAAAAHGHYPRPPLSASSLYDPMAVPPVEENMPLSATIPGKYAMHSAGAMRGAPYWDGSSYASPQQGVFPPQPFYISAFYEDPSAAGTSLAQEQANARQKSELLPGSLEQLSHLEYSGYLVDRVYDESSGLAQPKKKSKKKHTRRDDTQHRCTECETAESPEWRKGPEGPKTLCNACGLRWAKLLRTGETIRKGEASRKGGSLKR